MAAFPLSDLTLGRDPARLGWGVAAGPQGWGCAGDTKGRARGQIQLL